MMYQRAGSSRAHKAVPVPGGETDEGIDQKRIRKDSANHGNYLTEADNTIQHFVKRFNLIF